MELISCRIFSPISQRIKRLSCFFMVPQRRRYKLRNTPKKLSDQESFLPSTDSRNSTGARCHQNRMALFEYFSSDEEVHCRKYGLRAVDRKSKKWIVLFSPLDDSLDFWSGTEKRAPEWMRKWKIEWLYRALSNPKKNLRKTLVSLKLIKFLMWQKNPRNRRDS